MTRAVVCVATTPAYQRGMERLAESRLAAHSIRLHWQIERGWPSHQEKPYGFKGYALKEAAELYDLLLWCDSSVVPVRSMEPLWERIERDGAWISHNGWMNDLWCADSWYADCFPGMPIEEAREINRQVPHVVATCFGLNVRHEIGAGILAEYFRLASETRAFCGPWINSNYPGSSAGRGGRAAPCGPPEVMGHRHDQSCLSLLAHRFGVELTRPPKFLAYQGGQTEDTIMLVDGSISG